ncbi:unnamed protein product, partial [marine sediment metagenome]
YDQSIEQAAGPMDDVHVAQRDRIERTGEDGYDLVSVSHRLLSSAILGDRAPGGNAQPRQPFGADQPGSPLNRHVGQAFLPVDPPQERAARLG